MTWLQWVQLVEVPAILFLVAWNLRLQNALAMARNQGDAALSAFKLRVAETYATVAYLKDVESRVVTRLDKIDDKMDRVLERVTGHD